MSHHPNIFPLLNLVNREDPLELAWSIDRLTSFMVELNGHEGSIEHLAVIHQHGIMVRNALILSARDCPYLKR